MVQQGCGGGHYRKDPVTVFRDVTPYSLAEIYQRFGGNCSLHFQSGRNVLRKACKFPSQYRRHAPEDIRFYSHCHNPLIYLIYRAVWERVVKMCWRLNVQPHTFLNIIHWSW